MKVRIAVVCGGTSREREVSLRSGKNVYDALIKVGYEVAMVVYNGDPTRLLKELESFDLAFILLHGTFGEDGGIQFLLESFDIPYTCSDPYTSAVCFDKLITYRLVKDLVDIPEYVHLESMDQLDRVEIPEFPVVVKPRREGSSIGVKICRTPADLRDHVESVLDTYGSAIIQKYIKGQEITVSILEIDGVPTVLPILELRPRREFYDYIAKYTPGMTEFILPAEIPDDATRMVKETALRIYRYLECRDMARVDGIYSDGIFYFLEVNTIPGMTELSDLPASAKAMGMSFEDVVSCVVRSALRRKEVRKWKSSMELP